MKSMGSKSSMGQSKLGRSRLGQSALGQWRLGKPRRDGIAKAPPQYRKFGRAFASAFREGWTVLSGRRKKTKSMSMSRVGNVFSSTFGRGFGKIFQGRKDRRPMTNIFASAGLTQGIDASGRPEKGMAAASAGRGAGFTGGVFSSILGGEGHGLRLSLSKAFSGGLPSLPGGPQPSDLVVIIRHYVHARVKGDASAYREARNRLMDQVGTLLADRILRWCNGETAVPNDLTKVQGLENAPQLRETIIWARAVLDDLTMRDGTRNQLDNAATEDEAQREYEYIEETFGQEPSRARKQRKGERFGGRIVKSLATTAIKGTLGPFAVPLLLFSSAVDRWAERRGR